MREPVRPALAILFWFYRAPEVCADRLRHLRALNPHLPIYGLYGGDPARAEAECAGLTAYLDDLYVYAEPRDDGWKWRHGDQMIAAWHRDRGAALPWDTVVLVQWDLLLTRPVAELFAMLAPGEALFSGLRPEHEVVPWWGWLDPGRPDRLAERDAFAATLRDVHGYHGALWCCLFIVACLPRGFLDRYLAAGHPEIGFLEYKLPTLARAFGTPINTAHPFTPWWGAEPATREAPPERRLLNARHEDIPLDLVRAETQAGRAHAFHPVRQPFLGVAD